MAKRNHNLELVSHGMLLKSLSNLAAGDGRSLCWSGPVWRLQTAASRWHALFLSSLQTVFYFPSIERWNTPRSRS